jgi:hypothetical protein
MQGIIIASLELQNKFLDLQIAWLEVFGNSKGLANAENVRIAVMAGKLALAGLAGAAIAAGLGLALVVWGFAAIPVGIASVISKLDALDDRLAKMAPAGLKAAKGFVSGIIKGLVGGIPDVIGAVSNLATAAHTAFSKVLDMHSPSKLMIRKTRIGYGGGVVKGLQDSKPAIEKEVRDSIARPMTQLDTDSKAASASAAPRAQASQPVAVTFGDIKIEGAVTMADVQEGIRRGIEQFFGGRAVMVGA